MFPNGGPPAFRNPWFKKFWWWFLAVHNSSKGDLVTHWVTDSVTDSLTFTFDITEWPKRLATFETFVQIHEKTWHDQKIDKDKDKDKDKDNDKDKDKENH